MKRLLTAVLVLFLLAPLRGGDDCFTILAGKNATDTGCVMIGHNEDDRGKALFVNLQFLPARTSPAGPYRLRNGGTVPAPARAAGLFWIEIPETAYADTYINSHGVIIVSNATPSRESRSDLTAGGIGFMLRRIVAEQATSARQAVLLAGRLVETFGYADSGRTLSIADAREAWVLHLIRGRRWVARRVPDNQVALVPNAYTITTIDLADTENCLGSADLITHAREAGWFRPEAGRPFHFAAAYSRLILKRSRGNYLRQRRAIELLGGDRVMADGEYPFSFIPRRPVRLQDLFAVLRDHYEGTSLDLTDDYRKGSPNQTNNRTICTESTQYSLVAELGRTLPFTDSVPEILSNRLWLALGRPDSNAYLPWYPGIPFPQTHRFIPSREALTHHFDPPGKPAAGDLRYPFRVYTGLSDRVDRKYRSRIRRVRREWKNFEDYVGKSLRKKEKEFAYIFRTDPTLARLMIANHLERLEYLRWFQALELLRDLQD